MWLTYIMISWHVVICCVYCNYQGHNCSMSYYRYITGVYKSYWPELNRTLRSSSVPRTVLFSSIKCNWFQSQNLLIIWTQVPDLDSSRYVRGTSMPPNAYFSDSHSPYVARFSLFVFLCLFFCFLFLRLKLSLCGQVFLCSFFSISFFCFLLPRHSIYPWWRFLCVWVFFSPSLTPAFPLCVVMTTKFCGFLVYCFSFRTFFLRFPVLHLQRVSNGKDLVEVILWKWENMKGHIVYTTCHTYQLMYL